MSDKNICIGICCIGLLIIGIFICLSPDKNTTINVGGFNLPAGFDTRISDNCYTNGDKNNIVIFEVTNDTNLSHEFGNRSGKAEQVRSEQLNNSNVYLIEVIPKLYDTYGVAEACQELVEFKGQKYIVMVTGYKEFDKGFKPEFDYMLETLNEFNKINNLKPLEVNI